MKPVHLHIEAKGVLADAEREIIERYFPQYKPVES